MARTKGSKNKPKDDIAAAAIMPEDLEFDRELERLAKDAETLPPDISDPEPYREMVKTVDRPELLSSAIEDTKPAASDMELKEQIHLAKEHGCDSIEATLALCRRFCRDPELEKVGYFIFHDVKVYVEGHFERATKRDKTTIEQRVFGGK